MTDEMNIIRAVIKRAHIYSMIACDYPVNAMRYVYKVTTDTGKEFIGFEFQGKIVIDCDDWNKFKEALELAKIRQIPNDDLMFAGAEALIYYHDAYAETYRGQPVEKSRFDRLRMIHVRGQDVLNNILKWKP